MPRECTWLFGRGASIASGLTWVVPDAWKADLAVGRVSRDAHVEAITEAVREAMDSVSVDSGLYRSLLDIMESRTVNDGHHRLMTTNWDYLLQREVDAWIEKNQPGVAPRFLSMNSTVYHFNGSVEPGVFENRSPFLLETDSAATRKSAYEANKAFNLLLWSTLVVIVGMSFECDIDKGLLGALQAHEDNVPIGEALFIIVEPDREVMEATSAKLAAHFPRADIIRVPMGFGEWLQAGLRELTNGSLNLGNNDGGISHRLV